ncbi:hypothetical protein HPB51_018852 [Rhipicephalus microplus]|uniref:Uncharacterized protein n=1 Tax=Rhipicephalus microplus TaxID=6941 RepID=A0A9J6DNZ6_RHIMP|nr:hypothetical protein HPB51_018852 [Rhipicephalus microplus]
MCSSAPINAATIPENQSSFGDLIREIVCEELQKFRTPVAQTPVASVAELVRDEIRHAFSTAGPDDEHRPMSYAEALRRSPPGTLPPYHPVPTAPWSPPQEQILSRTPSQPTYQVPSTAPWTSSQEGRLRRVGEKSRCSLCILPRMQKEKRGRASHNDLLIVQVFLGVTTVIEQPSSAQRLLPSQPRSKVQRRTVARSARCLRPPRYRCSLSLLLPDCSATSPGYAGTIRAPHFYAR